MTVPVTLDNSRSSEAVTFEVQFSTFADEGATITSYAVAAGETKVVDVSVPDHTGLNFFVADEELWTASDGEQGGLAEKVISVSCAPNARGALATIGALDCASLTVAVTLDNTRATQATRFEVYAQDDFETAAPFDQTFVVAAGSTQVVQVPVRDHTSVYVSATDTGIAIGQPGNLLAEDFIDVACTPEPTSDALATVGHINCAALTLPVTLDNTRSSRDTTFVVRAGDISTGEELPVVASVHLAAGAERVLEVSVINHTEFGIFVVDDRSPAGDGPEDVLLSKDLLTPDCAPPAPRPTPETSVLAEATSLPATGGGGPRLPLLGLLLLTAGATLRIGSRRLRKACPSGRAGAAH